MFHVSQLRKYVYDPKHVIQHSDIELDQDLSYEERPEMILDRKVQQFRTKAIALVKIKWIHHGLEEATLEMEENIKEKYPELFHEVSKFRDEISLRGRECNTPSL